MADIWTVEVTLDGVTVTGPGPSATNTTELHKLEIDVEDDTGPNGTVTLEWTMEVHSFGGGPTYEYRTVARLRSNGADTTNTSWGEDGVVATLTEANGQNGAAWMAGGRLAVTKDNNTSTLTMDTPLGTSSVSLAAASMVTSGTFKGDGIYHRWDRPSPLTSDGSSQVAWSGFWTTKNGTRVSGAALGTNQPGDWFDNHVGDSPWFYGATAGTRINRANTQTATRLISAWTYVDATDNPRAGSSDEWRFWGNTGSIGEVPLVLDLCVNRKSGQILVARVKKQTPERITISSTENSGHTWTETEVDAGIGSFCSPPTLGVTPDGAFSLVFHDGVTANYYRSDTGGRTWEFGGVFIPALPWSTITVPAHFQHPSGLLMVTYTAGGDFKYGLFSVPTSAVTALATVTLAAGTANVYPAQAFLPKGGVIFAWSDATTKTQTRSDNLHTFTNDFTGTVSVERRPRHQLHPENGLSLHLYQDTGNLMFYGSEDGGITVLNPPAATIFAGAADQFADLDVTPVGWILVVFQSYDTGTDSWELTAYASDNGGVDWIAV